MEQGLMEKILMMTAAGAWSVLILLMPIVLEVKNPVLCVVPIGAVLIGLAAIANTAGCGKLTVWMAGMGGAAITGFMAVCIVGIVGSTRNTLQDYKWVGAVESEDRDEGKDRED